MDVQAVLLWVKDNIPMVFAVGTSIFLYIFLFLTRPGKPLPPFLESDKFKESMLVEKKTLNHNTRLFRFALGHPEQKLGLPTGQHITFKFTNAEGKDVFRPYTPVTDDDTLGFVDFVIKIYPSGAMGQHLDALPIGQTMQFKGPRGRFKYERNMYKAIGMIAGGSGITPMYQVAAAILKDVTDKTQLSLVYANVAEEDILLRKELDQLASIHQNFTVHYVLNKPPPAWTGSVGFVDGDILRTHMPPPGGDCMILRCGPPPMNKAVEGHLNGLGYAAALQFEF